MYFLPRCQGHSLHSVPKRATEVHIHYMLVRTIMLIQFLRKCRSNKRRTTTEIRQARWRWAQCYHYWATCHVISSCGRPSVSRSGQMSAALSRCGPGIGAPRTGVRRSAERQRGLELRVCEWGGDVHLHLRLLFFPFSFFLSLSLPLSFFLSLFLSFFLSLLGIKSYLRR